MRRVLVFIVLVGVTAAAAAQVRTIPKEAQRGEIRHLHDMHVELNGKALRLAPGAQIRDPDNRLVLPTSLVAKSDVRFLLDSTGLVQRVWIMTPLELTQAPPKPKPAVTLPAADK